jgi:hypothetical protein
MKRYLLRELQDVHKDLIENIRRQTDIHRGIPLKVQLYNSRLAPIAIFRFVVDDRGFVFTVNRAYVLHFIQYIILSQSEYYIRIYFIIAFIGKFSIDSPFITYSVAADT